MQDIMEHVLGHGEPIEKVFFQVVVDFNSEFIVQGEGIALESAALSTYPQAQEVIEQMLGNICGKFPGSVITELALEQESDEYHLCITAESGEEIAKLGIIAFDYNDVQIH